MPTSPSPPRGRWVALAPLVAIVALGLFAYANSLHGQFAFDDRQQVRDNPVIRDLGALLTPAGYRWNPSRYVAYVTFAINYRLGGLEVFGFHLTNLVIHLLASLLVYCLVRLAFQAPLVRDSPLVPSARAIAFVAGALFATHPLGTQAVTYVVQRVTSLATLFYLLSVVLYLSWRLSQGGPTGGGWRRAALYAGALLGALLAVRTKEIAFTLPAAVALAEFLLFPAGGWRRWVPVVPVGLVALLIPVSWIDFRGSIAAVTASAERATRLLTSVSRMDYLKTQAVVICEYLRLLAWPTGQNLDHDFPIYRSALDGRVLGSAALLLGLAAFGAWAAVRSAPGAPRHRIDPAFRLVAFGVGWFFVALAVESSVVPIVDVIYEHRAYLPSVGIFTAAATLLGLAFRRVAGDGTTRLTVLTGVALALVLASITLQRNAVWATPVSLWTDAAAKAPGKARPHLLLAESLEAAGRPADAEREYRRAVAIDPTYPPAHTSLATFLQKTGRFDEAEAEYRTVLGLDPGQHAAVFNLAELLWRSSRREDAEGLYRRFLTIAPPEDRLGRSIASSRVGGGTPAEAVPPPPPR